jgi:sec-independent protein translocase protein TatB
MFPEGRLFDFLIVGAVALIVVGPKDLPLLMRKVGQFMAKVRGMAAEFRASFDELARQSELDELRREVQALRTARPMDYAAAQLGAADVISEIKSDLADAHAEIAGQTGPTETLPVAEPPPAEPAERPATSAAAAPDPAPDPAPAAGAAEPAKPARKASAS